MDYATFRKFNKQTEGRFNKSHLARHNAAAKRGFVYNFDEDCYECPTCEQVFWRVEEIDNEHCCEEYLEQIDSNYREIQNFIKAQAAVVEATSETTVEQQTGGTMMFGSIPSNIPLVPRTVPVSEHSKGLNEMTNSTLEAQKTAIFTAKTLSTNTPMVKCTDPFDKLDEILAKRLEKQSFATITERKDGTLFYKYKSNKQLDKIKSKIQKQKEEEEKFQQSPPTIITRISIAGGSAPSQVIEIGGKRGIHTVPSMKTKQVFKKQSMTDAQFTNFVKKIKSIMAQKHASVEIITKKSTRLDYITRSHKTCARVAVLHLKGIKRRVDFSCDSWTSNIVKQLSKVDKWQDQVHTTQLCKGDSGVVLNAKKLKGHQSRSWNGMFIVRGVYEGKLFDARTKVTLTTMLRMAQFSHATEFWKGIDGNWAKYRYPTDHNCTPDISVADCGRMAALVTHSIIPCFKITCKECARKYAEMPVEELMVMLHKHAHEGLERLGVDRSVFPHVEQLLKVIRCFSEPTAVNPDYFDEMYKSIGDKQYGPFKHLNTLNNFFLKGKMNNSQEWVEAQRSLLELARFQKNRTDNIKKGDIASFRNKLSAKANWNFYLSCDNQLDKNANFVWGQREYHAKRFFSNFFEEIDPLKGYSSYEIRVHPNGVRKLSIGNLIVPLDLAEFRQKMKGDFIKQPTVGKQCTSLKEGNFVYPCCCTTMDDGTAVESTFYPPTKKHMVIGNSGDQKYVDLPKGETEMLYIAKEGYCYINIYLAMLINVNEEDAKDFTKKVRDLCVPKLGKWPTLMDLATTCAQLRIFYPDVHDAELPRILVDHNTQTCHVVDSFGSITTGFHILKAATVSQLILFANDELESDIKHYRVGGIPENADSLRDGASPFGPSKVMISEFEATKVLLKGIFRPKIMKQLLIDEPYIMLMAMLSPGILLAMYNNGSFEIAVKLWINEKQSLAMIATMLSSLATKVSVSETLLAQRIIMDTAASDLLDVTCDGFKMHLTYMTAIQLLQRTKEKAHSDEALYTNGFLNCERDVLHLMEKSYLDLLHEAWRDLTWREKLSAIWHSQKAKRLIAQPLRPIGKADLKGLYDISPSACLEKSLRAFKNGKENVSRSIRLYIHNKTVKVTSFFVNKIFRNFPSLVVFINVFTVVSLLSSTVLVLQSLILEHKMYKRKIQQIEIESNEKVCVELYSSLQAKLKREFTWEEYIEYLETVNPSIVEFAKKQMEQYSVKHQKSTPGVKNLEQVIAFVTLITMLFDSERSDCVFKMLNKLKGIVSTLDCEVRHQSLDDYMENFDNRNQTVDFELDDDITRGSHAQDTKFTDWWDRQIQMGYTIPHYRTEGHFMEITRAKAVQVASDIAQSAHLDFLIRGAVGSGKSTGLPVHLSSSGSVLLIEPTRPLAENVFKQLSSGPFFQKPTMRMRGNSVFGSSPISIMTSGFALHYFANNRSQLTNFTYIIFDECHVMDASAMAFRSLVSVFHKSCKVLKVSATPPGREVEFTTQFPVKLVVEDSLSFKSFTDAQGTKSNADVIQHGHNILVYVSSYNEVDSLSKLLTEKGMMVTKVDGRTMKHGSLEIITKGTASKPHFVVATNIIENGVTLDIDVVVDFGLKVSPFLDVDSRNVSYNKVNVSYGERIQRLGRVGRFKPGVALRIGHTEKGLIETPSMIATEAALACFAYNLPVMASNVTTSIIANCTVRQVKTMNQFELSPFFTTNFVFYDGTMHPAIHEALKKYKLRESITPLCEQSIPYRASSAWMSAYEYERIGVSFDLPQAMKIAFHIKDIPEGLHENLWNIVLKFKDVSIFPSIRSSSISKIAYTLNTDLFAIPRTLILVDRLIEEERVKQNQFRSYIDEGCNSMFSIVNLTNTLRSKYAKDYTAENIKKLEMVKSQLKEFSNLNGSVDEENLISKYESLQFVVHQSKDSLAKSLNLKGIWCKSLMVKDALIAGAVSIGGVCMIYHWFTQSFQSVSHQGKNKSKRIQALKFKRARDKRAGFEIDNNDDTIEEFFGSAYRKKGKNPGNTVGMGKSNRRFINMYGFEPGEFSYIQFVDPLTGAQIEENVYADIVDIQERFGEIRRKMIEGDELDAQSTYAHTTVHAYLRKDWSDKALKVDLMPHNPLKICDKTNGIAKFPEREGELRQTGVAVEVDVSEIPTIPVEHESKSLMKGLRDYNPIAQAICKLKVTSEFGTSEMYGIGFGAYIISNHHLFKSFNGTLEIRSHHGTLKVNNMMTLQVKPITGRDIIITKMPKDFPVFPQRLHFRSPKNNEKMCIVGSNFQEKSTSSTITETSATYMVPRSSFWKHWIATDDGHCGLPVVSTIDGKIIGIHSLANNSSSENYYAAFDDDFEDKFLRTSEHVDWVKNWRYNPDTVVWGPLKLTESTPKGLFKPTKILEDLFEHNFVREQSKNSNWMYQALRDNLQAVAHMKSQLVTKHVVKGECRYFQEFLTVDKEASNYFRPLMDAYGKSLLNQEAYVKDIMKYAEPIEIGRVDCDAFEEATHRVILYLQMKGFRTCSYVTDEQAIFKALNMKAAVGAMYGGKKKEYFQDFTDKDKEDIVMQSCLRLYKGELGIWNGSLKAELRCKEKIMANKTRTFTAAPLDTLLGGKVCVDDFNNQFYSKNIECCWTVGMTKFYGGWNRLLRSLPDNWIYCDADGSRFDSSLTPYLINAVLAIRATYMEDWDIGYQMLQNLYTEIVYTPISTPDGTVVKKFRGNNSGQPSTVVDNSLMVVLAMHYAFVKECIDFEEIDECCKFFVNGDDLLIAVNPEKEDMLDRFSDHFSSLGLNYDFSSRTKHKEELWFMSHRGLEIEGMYIPKLEEERVVSILQWDRAEQPEHRLEAICAAMIEAWGYPDLIHQIRRFYSWLLEKQPFAVLAEEGKAPYIANMALRKLYLDRTVDSSELHEFRKLFVELDDEFECGTYEVHHQGDNLDAGKEKKDEKKDDKNEQVASTASKEIGKSKDVNAGTSGTHTVPRIKSITLKMRMPKTKGAVALNLAHLLEYTPQQVDISNTRATQSQFDTWYAAVQQAYDISESEMPTVMNGLMVWCIENGTSPNINGTWVMMEGSEQVEFPLKPVIENAKPTFRQIMAHFSDVAEAYIEMRNKKEPYMPRYGLVRNLRDMSLARYAFDFYELTSQTSVRAREAHIQMKAAALKSAQTRMFGLDGGIGTKEENTERHTTEDVNPNMHTLLGVRNM
uniref:Genome polyprotein n=2 Tax=Sunflower chlorotic mottle virus TaxID=129732 RepID=D5J731_9POTV|nr:polyprotein [Sunflower chlorotic mottle virus]